MIALGASLSLASYAHWQRNEHALRLGQALPPSRLPRILVVIVAALAIGAMALAAVLLTSR